LFSRKVTLYATFDNVGGLLVGSPVRLAGVDVGIVRAIAFFVDGDKERVRVTLAVERSALEHIRVDSQALLTSKGLLGDMLIDLTIGSLDAQRVENDTLLPSATNAGLSQMSRSVEQALGKLTTLTTDVDDRVRALVTPDVSRDVSRAIGSTADVIADLEHGKGLLHALVYDEKLTDDAKKMVAEAREAAAKLGRIEAHLEETSINLESTMKTVRALTEEVNAGKGTIGGLVKDPTVYEKLRAIVGNIERNTLLKTVIRMTGGSHEATKHADEVPNR
jgi:phospholipid/cholesterol/gamma-HCH transport system substrate-binding protein